MLRLRFFVCIAFVVSAIEASHSEDWFGEQIPAASDHDGHAGGIIIACHAEAATPSPKESLMSDEWNDDWLDTTSELPEHSLSSLSYIASFWSHVCDMFYSPTSATISRTSTASDMPDTTTASIEKFFIDWSSNESSTDAPKTISPLQRPEYQTIKAPASNGLFANWARLSYWQSSDTASGEDKSLSTTSSDLLVSEDSYWFTSSLGTKNVQENKSTVSWSYLLSDGTRWNPPNHSGRELAPRHPAPDKMSNPLSYSTMQRPLFVLGLAMAGLTMIVAVPSGLAVLYYIKKLRGVMGVTLTEEKCVLTSDLEAPPHLEKCQYGNFSGSPGNVPVTDPPSYDSIHLLQAQDNKGFIAMEFDLSSTKNCDSSVIGH